MLFKTTLHAARVQPSWLRRRVCDVRGHAATAPLWGPHTQGYQRCMRCDRVVGSGE